MNSAEVLRVLRITRQTLTKYVKKWNYQGK